MTDGDAASLGGRVHEVMSTKLDDLTAGRIPFIGTTWDDPLGRSTR